MQQISLPKMIVLLVDDLQIHLTMGVARIWIVGGPMDDVVEIVQFYQPNEQCMRSVYTFYP